MIEIVPLGGCTQDEGPREPDWDKIRSLKPLTEGGRVTAACSSQISDASAALLVVNDRGLADHGLTPRARIHHLSVRADDPVWMLTAPIAATAHALKRTGLTLDDIDLVEINEAFAPQVLAVLQDMPVAADRLNVNGGAIALGHPIGATGARIVVTLVHELRRRGGGRGLATLCVSGGLGMALAIEARG